MRMIDVDALKKKYCDCCAVGTDCMGSGCKIYAARCLIKDLPTIEAEPVRHGRWIQTTLKGYYECSACGYEHTSNPNQRFCSYCGARMDLRTPTEVELDIVDSVMMGDANNDT